MYGRRTVDKNKVERIRNAYVTRTWAGERVSDLTLANEFGVTQRDVSVILSTIRKGDSKTKRKINQNRNRRR